MFFGRIPKIFHKKARTIPVNFTSLDLEYGNVAPSPSVSQDLKSTSKVSLLKKIRNKALRRSSPSRGPPPNLDEEVQKAPSQPRKIVIKSRHLQSLKPEDVKRIFHCDFDISQLPTMKPAPPCPKPYEQNALHFQFRFSDPSRFNLSDESTPTEESTLSSTGVPSTINTVSSNTPNRRHSILHPCKLTVISEEEEDLFTSVSNCNIIV
uniref:Protein phosphatase 1 regulatory subunit 35 C-terminal domain-containing protein n=1 Tax=Panagrellus redivivus TaxID=6233 RepID=A0A7E4VA76_PANRE